MTTLAAIEQEWHEIEALLDASGGEVTPEIEARLRAFDLAEADKVDGYIHIIRDLKGRAKLAREQAGERRSKAESLENRAQWLTDTLETYMRGRGLTELRGALSHARIQKHGGKPLIELLVEEDDVPYPLSVAQPRKVNLKLLGEALDDPNHPYHREAVRVARFGERGESVRLY